MFPSTTIAKRSSQLIRAIHSTSRTHLAGRSSYSTLPNAKLKAIPGHEESGPSLTQPKASQSEGRESPAVTTKNVVPKRRKPSSKPKAFKKKDDKPVEPAPWADRSRKFLANLDRSPPTLKDLLALKPSAEKLELLGLESPSYQRLYNRTRRAIDRSFDKTQLSQFAQALGVSSISGSSKEVVTSKILNEVWGMKPPLSPKPQRPDIENRIPLTMAQLFLLLGKDGSGLVQLATDFNVRIKPILQPLSINISGAPSDVKALENRLQTRHGSLVTKTFKPEELAGLDPGLVHAISRAAGAYIQILEDSSVSITADDRRKISSAQRLALQHAFQKSEPSIITPLLHLHPTNSNADTNDCALFPHAISGSLPWYLAGDNVFRMRRVGGEAADLSREEDGNNLLDDETHALWDALFSYPLSPGHQCTISARSGHVVIPSSQSKTLIPPVEGTLPGADLVNGIAEVESRFLFVPNVPAQAQVTHDSTITTEIQRLIYRVMPSKEANTFHPKTPIPQETLIVDFIKPVPTGAVATTDGKPSSKEQSSPPIRKIIARKGSERRTYLLLPDRQLDLEFSISQTQDIHRSALPREIGQYLNQLERQTYEQSRSPTSYSGQLLPEPPYEVRLDGRRYHLSENTVIYQTELSPSKPSVVSQMRETLVDVETEYTSNTVKVECQPTTPESQREFLRFCNQISLLNYGRSTRLPPISLELDTHTKTH